MKRIPVSRFDSVPTARIFDGDGVERTDLAYSKASLFADGSPLDGSRNPHKGGLREAWLDGKCIQVCGRDDGHCECERLARIDVDDHGDPKFRHEPCTCNVTPNERTDAMSTKKTETDHLDATSEQIAQSQAKREKALADAWKNPPQQDLEAARVDAENEPDPIVRALLRKQAGIAHAHATGKLPGKDVA